MPMQCTDSVSEGKGREITLLHPELRFGGPSGFGLGQVRYLL